MLYLLSSVKIILYQKSIDSFSSHFFLLFWATRLTKPSLILDAEIDVETAKLLDLPVSWHLKAQLVFGSIKKSAKEKTYEADEKLFRIFRDL